MSRLVLALVSLTPFIAARQPQPYTTTSYPSSTLHIEAYVYRPTGAGPFPVVIYSHGSRKGYEREERPMVFVGNMLSSAGYLVVVPERRGYGKSDGRTFNEEVGTDVGARMIARLEAEADDVIAAIAYAGTIDGADMDRLALVGFSQGGSVSIRVASKRPNVRALVDQAGGSLTWPRSPDLQKALTGWAKTLKMPVLCMDAANDATTDAVKAVCDAAHRAGGAETHVTIYPAFTPASNPDNIAPGHLIFAPGAGVAIWRQDLVTFLNAHTRAQ
ncbi:MAG TPA: alpha/beta fold hydrolase [Vicinamibacterales bacterium]|nr:alpha/beta fold hydrolase [Vicinamibacterales bacterium]